ncbi:MAG: HEPN domain-containing protein [Clostridia bacterium]|nr:HEPN domain-containing protein [Clostridia bacterium]
MDQLSTKDLALHRLQSAKDRLRVAEELLERGHYLDAASKAYYAIFQAARAVLATLKLDSRKHSGVISMFNLHFVKSGILPKEFRKIIVSAQDLRLASDYDDFYIISKDEALTTVDDATRFIQGIEEYLQKNLP